MDLLTGIFASVVFFIGFFIKGIAGFGDPLITTPLLSINHDNKVISPCNLLLSLPINAYISWKNRRAFSIRAILPMLVCILLGVIPGTLLMKYATSWVLKACLGVLILGIGVEMLTRDRMKPAAHRPVVMAVASFFSGVTAGLYGINLFFVAYIERTAKDRGAFRGSICFVFFIENCFRTLVYLAGGVFTLDVFRLGLFAVPGVLLGLFAGTRLDMRISDKALRRVVTAMFMLAGLSSLIKAVVWKA